MINFIKTTRVIISLLLISLMFGCSNFDDNWRERASIDTGTPGKIIEKTSDLYINLQKATTSKALEGGEVPPCVEFVYPLSLKKYDSDLNTIGSANIWSDAEFSKILENLPNGQSLSISYPIATTLEDNTKYTVNNNAELAIALKNCSREDIIRYYTDLLVPPTQNPLQYFWRIKYSETGDNTYFSGSFLINSGGYLLFYYNTKKYYGTFFFLFVDDKLHININLEGDSEVAKYWNIDREVEVDGINITIKTDPKDIKLELLYESKKEYKVGDIGPAKGIVFYDKGEYTFGWRYMEVATKDLKDNEWGCATSAIPNARNTELGTGFYNTAQIVNYHDRLANYYANPSICNSTNNGTLLAKDAIKQIQDVYIDWFLPSEGELELIYKNLYLNNLGNFTDSNYWSSSEIDSGNVITIVFKTGEKISTPKIPVKDTTKARAIRYF
ncbi:hypothetical protein [Flavobacterium bizetiae]|uniref:hypothetical protein n=1 Tax=Flavobacterium bizetiae TaxID=2704140 RepID=UPI0037569025